MPLSDLIALLAVLIFLGLLLGVLRFWQIRMRPHPETSRKALHIGMGTVTLTFPWIFSSPQSVVLLALLAFAFLFYARKRGLPGAGDEVLHAVNRVSFGELCFPLGVAALFVLSRGDPLYYWPPLLVLTFADALAALVGTRIGALRYRTDDGEKTLEGSLAFLVVAFASTLLAILCWGDVSPERAFSIAALFGMVAVVIEAIAWRGLDNLFLPVLGYLFLEAYLGLPSTALWTRFALLLALLAFTFWLKNRTSLNDSALIGAALFGYLAFAAGGLAWAVPPLILFVLYPRFIPYRSLTRENVQPASGVLAVVLIGLLWLLHFRVSPSPWHLYPYTFSFAAFLSIIWINRCKANRSQFKPVLMGPLTVLPAFVIVFLPYFFVFAPHISAATLFPVALGAGLIIAWTVAARAETLTDKPPTLSAWRFRVSWVGAFSLPLYLLAARLAV